MGQEEKGEIIQAKKASPEVKAWHDRQLEMQQKQPERIEEAAKFLSGMISISLTIFLSMDKAAFKGMESSTAIKVSMMSWLLSLLLSFMVLLPLPFFYNKNSAEAIQKMNQRVVRYKYSFLITATVLFFGALAVLVGLFLA